MFNENQYEGSPLYSGKKKEARRLARYPSSPRTGTKRNSNFAFRLETLRQKRPRRHARPWLYRTRFDEDAALEERAAQGVRGSLPERILYKALTDRGFRAGFDFVFQIPELGGRQQLGGLMPDFVFPIPKVIVQVQSYWHTISLFHTRRDDEHTLLLNSLGYQVLEIWQEEVEDQTKLDEWLDRNIMNLWGTNHQNLGVPKSKTVNFMEAYGFPLIHKILVALGEIKEILELD